LPLDLVFERRASNEARQGFVPGSHPQTIGPARQARDGLQDDPQVCAHSASKWRTKSSCVGSPKISPRPGMSDGLFHICTRPARAGLNPAPEPLGERRATPSGCVNGGKPGAWPLHDKSPGRPLARRLRGGREDGQPVRTIPLAFKPRAGRSSAHAEPRLLIA
jgi:hypothetical protein